MNILCFGDSNTYGYRPDGSGRFDADTRWTGLLQKKLGTNDRIIEEGLCGRTTVFSDELREGRRGLDTIGILLESHAPVDLLILMLGTNDCKTRYNASAGTIVKMFFMEYLTIALIANLLALPLAWLFMQSWLQQYAYRSHISAWMYIVIVFATITLIIGTVLYQTIQAARTNPAEVIKSE